MKFLRMFLLAFAVTAFSLSVVPAEEREILYQSKGKGNIFKKAADAAQRTRPANYDASVRGHYDAHVYRDEGLATAREEFKTFVLSVYCDIENPRNIYFGHALAD